MSKLAKRFFILLVILTVGIIPISLVNAQTEDIDLNKYLYSDLKNIEQFYSVNVNIQGDENIYTNAKKMNIIKKNYQNKSYTFYNSEYLTDYLKLKIKNNMHDIDIMTGKETDGDFYSKLQNLSKKEKKKYGTFYIRIWLIGNNYPVAYHIQATFSNVYSSNPIWKREYLGYDNSSEIENISKDIIDKMVEQASITYLKVKGEI